MYSHIFKFQVGSTGADRIIGEFGLDTQGQIIFTITETSQPFSAKTLSLFLEYINLIKKIYDETGGIKLISVKDKVV